MKLDLDLFKNSRLNLFYNSKESIIVRISNIKKIMFFWVIFSVIGVPISIYALDEPTSMRSDDGSLQDYYYLSEERQKLGYDGPPSNYETGVKLIRVDEMDKENGAYKLVFWHWVKINEKDDPTNFVHEKPSFHYVNADTVEIDEQHIEPHYFEQKVIGHFHGPMNFENFPFEQLVLQIIIEPGIQKTNLYAPFSLSISSTRISLTPVS